MSRQGSCQNKLGFIGEKRYDASMGSGLRLLVVHTWLRGNLGDVLQASVLLRSLRELEPKVLDLGGYPAHPGRGAAELVALADRHVPEPFAWYLRYLPARARRLVAEPLWRAYRTRLFRRYDAIVSAPGPFLAAYDPRAPAALADLALAADLGIPFILSSHSIGPLDNEQLSGLTRATQCVAREIATHEYLDQHGIFSVLSADYAFLYPYAQKVGPVPAAAGPGPYRVLVMRSNNYPLRRIERRGSTLRCGPHSFVLEAGERIVLATTDPHKDARFLRELGGRLGASTVSCESVPELISLVAGSTGIISDRYHPAICARALGKPAEVIINREPHKMRGLQALLAGHDLSSLENMARAGLAAVRAALPST